MTADDDRLGEQVVVVFLATSDAETLEAVRQGLAATGLGVFVASSEATPSIRLDYENARYLIVLLEGRVDGPPPRATRVERVSGIKVVVFPGAPVSEPPSGSVRLDLADEMWPISLVEAILAVV
jgi:hypothetical protein